MTKPRYQHQTIEAKWQKKWEEKKTFKSEYNPKKPKYYALDMFPYPSGAGLHVGHVEGYTATDILARYKRKKGFNVLHPMGWDSFGLPAEQYAIRTGTHPAVSTKQNIDNFRRQLKSLGFSYDWDREIATSDPTYYKWTQWIFTKLYEKGLAYEADVLVNWCPALGTVLSNEEVDNGRSIDGGHLVERKPLRQWMLKITQYAERLIDDLDLVDWPESLKKLQINWIGKSQGAEVRFKVDGIDQDLTIYTTCPDTLFGVTFMVLAPEHPLVGKITTNAQKCVVEDYQRAVSLKSDLARTDLNREKTGVNTGGFAINPVNGKKIPIWIADYVLMSYGTGAIMAVPSHDERDFEFAMEYDLPVVPVFNPNLDQHPELIPMEMKPEQVREAVLKGKFCWTGEGTVINSANDEFSINGLSSEEAKASIVDWIEKKKSGKRSVCYKLRDWLFSRQRYWAEPFPILHFADGSARHLELDELPLCPPELQDFRPSGDGRSPLAKVPEWIEITDPKTGKKAKRETNTMPQWAGSCWYYLRFCDPHNTKEAWDKKIEDYWMPVDMYVGGVEHAVLHLLYARFWHKVLFDCGLVSTNEPFKTLRNQGIIVARSFKQRNGAYVDPVDVVQAMDGTYTHKKTGETLQSQVEKMSKSKLNGVTPDDIIEEFGADSLRLYEMFMGPLEKEKIWNTDAVNGCRRFLSRIYDLATADQLTSEDSEEAFKLAHRLIQGVTDDIESLQFNTAIAKMMEFVNDFTKLPKYPKNALLMAVHALSAFAPHLAEEMWELLGGQGELTYAPYPTVDPKYLEDAMITYVVQVNGKLRGRFDLPKDQTQEVILDSAMKDTRIAKLIEGETIKKVIFVPNKLLNLVTK